MLEKQIWLAILMELYYSDPSWLNGPVDMSSFVENDIINLADCGVDPTVIVNNSVWPIPTAQRDDSPLALELDTFDTANTLVRNVEEMELAYDKMASVLRQHANALMEFSLLRAAYNYAPASSGSYTPVIQTSGEVDGDTNRLKLTRKDIFKLMEAWNNLKVPNKGRVLVLNPTHMRHLLEEDTQLFNQVTNQAEGKVIRIANCDIYEYVDTPKYNGQTATKKAFGASAAPATDSISTIGFVRSEVMKADGRFKMFSRIDDPDQRGDIVGFQKRFLALPIRNKGIGSIISTIAA